ncbi:hypothetical protein [Amycolatopsis methanolica]|uniref:hypothetical protein n=1 Tax=Amycolatopsis methanolica TaxID=1814 RepID=UPI00341D3446
MTRTQQFTFDTVDYETMRNELLFGISHQVKILTWWTEIVGRNNDVVIKLNQAMRGIPPVHVSAPTDLDEDIESVREQYEQLRTLFESRE